ncbi:hypothetical protein K457DRAFT_14035 [Linnemannia elongata AG-77]|uniref:Uncharacterized protein n=1 Tax=Linnemannia elongata AG-77 TaxID=1314771 RepID=A0A197KEL6_9FUNG|nr:hypothetical protein K457DRAFT_14035 [Linnemannia elongata AG-77]
MSTEARHLLDGALIAAEEAVFASTSTNQASADAPTGPAKVAESINAAANINIVNNSGPSLNRSGGSARNPSTVAGDNGVASTNDVNPSAGENSALVIASDPLNNNASSASLSMSGGVSMSKNTAKEAAGNGATLPAAINNSELKSNRSSNNNNININININNSARRPSS